MIFWLTQTTLLLSPLALIVCILIGGALGWTLYGLRGYYYWYKRFHRYGSFRRRRIRMRPGYGYVEYPPELSEYKRIARATPFITKKEPQKVKYSTKDDLQLIEGIGPKIEIILNEQGIYTWRELAQTPVTNLKKILENAGKQFTAHDPTTWPKQAQMADTGYWNELKEYQDILFGGRKEKALE